MFSVLNRMCISISIGISQLVVDKRGLLYMLILFSEEVFGGNKLYMAKGKAWNGFNTGPSNPYVINLEFSISTTLKST